MFANYIVKDLQNFITMPLGRPIGGLNDFPYLEFWFVLFWILIHVCLCFVLFVCLWVWVDILQCVHGGQRTDKIGCQSPPSTLSQPFVGQPCTKQTRSQTPCEHLPVSCLTTRGWDCTHQPDINACSENINWGSHDCLAEEFTEPSPYPISGFIFLEIGLVMWNI